MAVPTIKELTIKQKRETNKHVITTKGFKFMIKESCSYDRRAY